MSKLKVVKKATKVAKAQKVKEVSSVESRVVTQLKTYRLIMNPLTAPKETAVLMAMSLNRKAMIDWMNGLLATKNRDSFDVPSEDLKGNKVTIHIVRDFEKDSYLKDVRKVKPVLSEEGHGIDFIWLNEDEFNKIKSECTVVVFEGIEILTFPAPVKDSKQKAKKRK